ncbi:MAG: hypothetical protein ACK5HR_06720 [Mycoplasmatales bacterium]
MNEKDLLNMYFDMKYHHHEYSKRRETFELLNIDVDNFNLTDKERYLVESFHVDKKKLKDLSEESGISYGYLRHKIGIIRKKILKDMMQEKE